MVMPNLIGMREAEVSRRLGALESETHLGLGSEWRTTPITGCQVRPGTVIVQKPAPGDPIDRTTAIRIRTAVLALHRFRGPCEPADGDLGPLRGPDAVLARTFYRFAADQSRPAPFANGSVWNGIEAGPHALMVHEDELLDSSAWLLQGGYAEAVGPFSSLDILAASGGYYELHRGIVPACPRGNDEAPPAMEDLRAISLTAPSDSVTSCSQWWGVTLFLKRDLIRGVALRLGSP